MQPCPLIIKEIISFHLLNFTSGTTFFNQNAVFFCNNFPENNI